MNEAIERKQTAGESGNTQDNVRQVHRRITALWVAVVALAVILSGVASYGYLAMEKHNIQLAQLPGFSESLALLGERLNAIEGKLRARAKETDRLEARLSKLNRKMRYNRELARTEARKAAESMAAQVQEHFQADLEEHSQATDARLRLLESGQDASRARLAQIQEQVAAARTDAGRDLARLHEDVARGERHLDALARSLERRRVDFELVRNKTRELARGVSLRVTGTNVSRQRVKGWMWLMPDRKTIWVRRLGIQQPLVFYHRDGSGPNELVITQVSDGAVAGYLLLSGSGSVDVTASAAAAETAAPLDASTEATAPASVH